MELLFLPRLQPMRFTKRKPDGAGDRRPSHDAAGVAGAGRTRLNHSSINASLTPGKSGRPKSRNGCSSEGREKTNGKPCQVQDRYSLRCLPQYIGPIVEGIARSRSNRRNGNEFGFRQSLDRSGNGRVLSKRELSGSVSSALRWMICGDISV